MNKQRRKELSALRDRWEKIKAEMISLKDELEQIKDAEDEAYNNLPDSVRDGDKGSAMSEFVDAMTAACEAIEDCAENGVDFDNMYDAQ